MSEALANALTWPRLISAVVILILAVVATGAETPVLKVQSFYEVVTVWYPPFVEPDRIDSTYLFTVTTDMQTGIEDTTR